MIILKELNQTNERDAGEVLIPEKGEMDKSMTDDSNADRKMEPQDGENEHFNQTS